MNFSYKPISGVSQLLNVAPHTLRFWETKFSFLSPKKIKGHRYYSERDIRLLRQIKSHLKDKGYSIRGVQAIIKAVGVENFRNIPVTDKALDGYVPVDQPNTTCGEGGQLDGDSTGYPLSLSPCHRNSLGRILQELKDLRQSLS